MENVNTPPALKVTESPGLSLSTEELPAPVEAIRNLSNPMSTRNSGSVDPEQEVNKKTVLAFYAAINKRDFDAASKASVTCSIIPSSLMGLKASRRSSVSWRKHSPGDFVILHTNGVRAPGSAARRSSTSSGLKTDVIQPIPENAVNQNGMF